MADQKTILNELLEFRNREKFSISEWNARGLIPCDSAKCSRLELEFNSCADRLIESVNANEGQKQFRSILRKSLKNFDKNELDTEEREFICDIFFIVCEIVSIDFKDDMSKWLYGSVLSSLLKVSSFVRGPEKVVSTLSQDCTGCGSKLETFITKREKGIPDYAWTIVQCAKCSEYNLLSHGPDIKELRFGQYKMVEQLPKTVFTEEQAKTRLEQIKFFRKK
ncbi:MAG: DUF4844 domain-containing protein [Bacteroidetes bacterium]|nr:DUF4844 domain-containing protein [Bacteroidota bacterium]